MQSLSHIKLIFGTILLIELIVVINGQFFTKTGSKSIPRMGRRADNSMWSLIPPHSSYNRKVIEALLQKYNDKNSEELENSMTGLERKATDDLDASNEHDLKAKKDNSKTASFPLEDNDDQFSSSTEVRKLQTLLKSFIDKTQNGL